MNRPIVQLMLVQIREFYREPGIIFWSLLFPVLMAWGLGIAFSNKPETTRTIAVVYAETGSEKAFHESILKSDPRQLTDSLSGKSIFIIDAGNDSIGKMHYRLFPASWHEANIMVKRGKSPMIISYEQGRISYLFDKYNSEAVLSYLQLSSVIGGIKQTSGNGVIKPLVEKGTRYIDFLIPGLIAMNVMMSTMWGISYSLIEARTKKLLRRMVATPMPRWEYMASHFIARLLLCSVEAAIIFSFAWYYFDITVEGSVIAFVLMFFSGIVAFSGIAVLVACRTSKTQIGNGLINLVVMPMMLLSGIYFSYFNFPQEVITYIQALPLTLLADPVKAIFNEGAGIADVWLNALILNIIGLLSFIIGLRFFKWY